MAASRAGIPYGFLIDAYHAHDGDSLKVIAEVKSTYPSVYIGRKDRFIQTIKRIISPTIPSIKGKISIEGDALLLYREKIWRPRIRNFSKPYSIEIVMIQLSLI